MPKARIICPKAGVHRRRGECYASKELGGTIMNQVLENIKSRRSIRSFLPKPISREDLEIIAQAGQYAPTAMNLSLIHIYAG